MLHIACLAVHTGLLNLYNTVGRNLKEGEQESVEKASTLRVSEAKHARSRFTVDYRRLGGYGLDLAHAMVHPLVGGRR